MTNAEVAALEFLVDAGVTQAYSNEPNNRFKTAFQPVTHSEAQESSNAIASAPPASTQSDTGKFKPHTDIIQEAQSLASASKTLEELQAAIQNFDGLEVKKTATQIVFADGNPKARVMIIGEAPGADEDRQGKPFVGVSGQLLDKIVACIGLSRTGDTPENSIYISNILNWRPPGNRTPTAAEMDIAFPFIQKHIELIKPKILVFCGGVAAQTLLQSKESISRLRGTIYNYTDEIKAIATYHPAFLLRTPLQKKKVWEDMLMLQEVING